MANIPRELLLEERKELIKQLKSDLDLTYAKANYKLIHDKEIWKKTSPKGAILDDKFLLLYHITKIDVLSSLLRKVNRKKKGDKNNK